MRNLGLVAALAVALTAGTAVAAETEADWLKKPTPEQLFAVWPTEAFKRGVGGRARISCAVSVRGGLYGCKVLSETPAGMGFGAAAIALTPQFLMKPATRDGKPVEGEVDIPVNFTQPDTGTGTHIPGRDAPGLAPMTRTVVSNIVWNQAPSYDDVAAAYPEKARASGASGRVILKCTMMSEGRLGGCSAISEEPKGLGFAAAARSLIPKFAAPTQFSDGRPIKGSMTQVPFVFAPDMLDPAKRLASKVQWAVLPSGDALSAGYPRKAIEAGVSTARVVMLCTAGEGGRLEDCSVTSEEPAGLGFAEAGMALSKSFRIRPWTEEGVPTIGGKIRVPVRYNMPDAAPTPSAAKP